MRVTVLRQAICLLALSSIGLPGWRWSIHATTLIGPSLEWSVRGKHALPFGPVPVHLQAYFGSPHLHPLADLAFFSLRRSCPYFVVMAQPEGKDMKQIVHDFALSQENGALESRYASRSYCTAFCIDSSCRRRHLHRFACDIFGRK